MPTETSATGVAGSDAPPAAVTLPMSEALPLSYSDGSTEKPSRFRWVVLTMVFFAITINYIDRMVIGLLAPDYLKQPNGPISEAEFGYIGTAFGVAYAFGQAGSGKWLDWIGVRVGYAVALASWSIASMLHALVSTALGFGFMRALLGVTESPAYPAATKTLAEWFPKKERAFAMGIANAGANVGAVVAPFAVPLLALHYGWHSAFIVAGAVGLFWLLAWIPLYRRPENHPRVNAAELSYILSDPPEAPGNVRWKSLITYPQAWAFMIGKAMTDPVWSFYLFWLPSFLKKNHGISGTDVMMPMIVAYVMADVGSIAGGWLSSTMMRRGWSLNSARKTTLLICALTVVPVIAAVYTTHLWLAVILIGTALAAHQGFSSNLYTLVSDMFPKRAVASMAGLGGTCGYLGFGLFSSVTGWILQHNGQDYTVIFYICGLAYLVAFLAIQLLAPRLEQAVFTDEKRRGEDILPMVIGFAIVGGYWRLAELFTWMSNGALTPVMLTVLFFVVVFVVLAFAKRNHWRNVGAGLVAGVVTFGIVKLIEIALANMGIDTDYGTYISYALSLLVLAVLAWRSLQSTSSSNQPIARFFN